MIQKNKNIYYVNNKSKDLILFIPGLMMNIRNFDIDNLILNTNIKIDFITWNIYRGHNVCVDNKKDLNRILKESQKILDECYKRYKNIYIITFSFGFEILLKLKLNKKIKKVSAWSPSFFYPQDNCGSLVEHDRDFYKFNKNYYIYKKLAHQLDKLDTFTYIQNIKFPVNIYLDKDDIKKSWSKVKNKYIKINNLKFGHNYSNENLMYLYKKTINFFF